MLGSIALLKFHLAAALDVIMCIALDSSPDFFECSEP